MITRNNYEEFFLLYVDNELSPAERQAVESFVESHPDLREEWELLMQCKVSPDEAPVFAGKDLLMRGENPSLVNMGNYETWFLSYIDGELDATGRQAVIDFVHRHPDKNIELQRLQRTVNIPDTTIVFPHKETLYRREERRIAWLPFMRIAAAALVLGAVGLLVFHPFGKTDTPSVAKAPSVPPAKTPVVTDTTAADTPGALADATHSTEKSAPGPTAKSTPLIQPVVPPDVKKQLAAVTPRTADTLHLYKSKQPDEYARTTGSEPPVRAEKGTVEPVLAKIDQPIPDKTITSVKMPPATGNPIGIAEPSNKVITPDPKASFATQALLSHTVAYTDEGSMEETASPRKNKLRGIFRKVTRALEKPASRQEDDDKKVLIGGFQFALQ